MPVKIDFAYNLESRLSVSPYNPETLVLDHTVQVGKWDEIFHKGAIERNFNKVVEIKFSTSAGSRSLDPQWGCALHPAVLPLYFLADYETDAVKELHKRSKEMTFGNCSAMRLESNIYSTYDAAAVLGFVSKVFQYDWTAGTRKWFDKLTADQQDLIYKMDSFSRFMLHLDLAGATHVTRGTSEQWQTYVEYYQFSRENMLAWLHDSNLWAKRNFAKYQDQQVAA